MYIINIHVVDLLDPNINILLSSPGRTGSRVILHFFVSITKITPRKREYYQNVGNLHAKEILHSHNLEDTKLSNEHTLFILSKRDICQSVISWFIANREQKWVHYNTNYKINPFYLDEKDFIIRYNIYQDYYKQAISILPTNTVTINYSDIENDFTNLFDLFKLSKKRLKFVDYKKIMPVKTPGTHNDIILNYQSLVELSKNL